MRRYDRFNVGRRDKYGRLACQIRLQSILFVLLATQAQFAVVPGIGLSK